MCKKENAIKNLKFQAYCAQLKPCDQVFPSTMEVLMHMAKEHSHNFKENLKEIKHAT